MPTQNTIIAAFRSTSDAQAAATELESAGVSRSDIYLESGSEKSSRSKKTEGGITGWFKSIFEGDEDDRSTYEDALTRGNCVLRVDADEQQIPTVENILNRHSPIDVHADRGGATAARTRNETARGANAEGAIPVVEEEVQVGKRRILRGGVRVYSRVIEQPIEERVDLREEHVRVERQPVNRAATSADLSGGQEKTIEVQEYAEEPVVAKQARVVEEVRVGKDVSERTENVRDTVRRTEVNVEQLPGGSATGAGAATASRGTTGSGTTAEYDDSDFRSDFQNRYATGGAKYDTYLPAYRYGYDMASDPRYQGRSFEEVESNLRTDYGQRYPNSTWEKMKDAVRYGWDKVTGKARATAR